MSTADFVVSGGIVGGASLRVGFRSLLPTAPRWARRVSDDEASDFVASLAPAAGSAPREERHHVGLEQLSGAGAGPPPGQR